MLRSHYSVINTEYYIIHLRNLFSMFEDVHLVMGNVPEQASTLFINYVAFFRIDNRHENLIDRDQNDGINLQ